MAPRPLGRALSLLFLGFASLSCGDGGGSSSGSPLGPGPVPTGTVAVTITGDAPVSRDQALFVTFSEVSARRDGQDGFERLPFAGGSATQTCDLKLLRGGRFELLASGLLPEGHYAQLRLTVVAATVYLDDRTFLPACAAAKQPPRGASAAVRVSQGEVRIGRAFDVRAGATTTIALDFDGVKSLRSSAAGEVFEPVIRVHSIEGP